MFDVRIGLGLNRLRQVAVVFNHQVLFCMHQPSVEHAFKLKI